MIQSTSSRTVLPLTLGCSQLSLDHRDECATGVIECLGQFEDRGERRLLLAQLQNAHVGAAQVGLEAELFLRQARLLAQLTKDFSERNRWLQIFLPLLEELSRTDMIVSSYSYRNVSSKIVEREMMKSAEGSERKIDEAGSLVCQTKLLGLIRYYQSNSTRAEMASHLRASAKMP